MLYGDTDRALIDATNNYSRLCSSSIRVVTRPSLYLTY